MPDRYVKMINSSLGKTLAKRLGLPQPVLLDRYVEGNSFLTGDTLIGASEKSLMVTHIRELLAGQPVPVYSSEQFDSSNKLKTVIYDATGIAGSNELDQLPVFFSRIIKSFGVCTRVVLIGLAPEHCPPGQGTAQRALLGFVKSLAKEMRFGGTVNLIWATAESGQSLAAPLAFFASDRSAYVSGQFVKVCPAQVGQWNFSQSLSGRNILVTGAARGIGRAIAELIRFRGGTPTCVDVPQSENDLKMVASELNGDWLTLDITSDEAGLRIANHFSQKPLHGIVHNAGITRDKKLVNMKPEMWNLVLRTNLCCQEIINEQLISQGVLETGGRIVLVSSISGIGGNAGQTNYATSKAGVIGMVESFAKPYFERGITINAVAPGFIETQMVVTIPFALRQAGRRLNSLSQGGQPVDVAEAVSLFLQEGSQGLNGNVLRVCGQALMGA